MRGMWLMRSSVRSNPARPSPLGVIEMAATPRFRCAVLSAIKHDYVARGVASHPRFDLVVVADVHGIPYVCDVERALEEFNVQVAIVSPEAERHCKLSIWAARAGKHIIQD